MEEAHGSPEILTVHELVSRVRASLEQDFAALWVTGEVSNLRTPHSGHAYFTLKDEDAQIQAVFFKYKRRYIRFDPEDGMQVLCRGGVTVYEVRGSVQLRVDYMEPLGVGALHMAFEQIKERLAGEGLFDPAHKKPLPLVPQRIGVVTSPTGAAIQDILNIINRRFANVEILIAPVRVQGEAAAAEIAEAVDLLNRRGGLDVIILARGGGSLEDLWPFNEESVARAIFASRIPVISAVGHETDFTISDFAADFRAPTPSAAAELVVRNKAEIEERLETFARRLQSQCRRLLDRKRSAWEVLSRRLVSPEQGIGMIQQRLDDWSEALVRAVRTGIRAFGEQVQRRHVSLGLLNPVEKTLRLREMLGVLTGKIRREAEIGLQGRKDRLSALAGQMHALSPLNVLQRGYSIVTRLPGREIVRESRGLKARDRLNIRFHSGQAECSVENIQEG